MDNLIKEINSIHDTTELRILRDVVSDRIKVIGSVLKYSLNRGELVTVRSNSMDETGTIKKVNRTKALVDINGKLWNVPFTLIPKISEREGEINE